MERLRNTRHERFAREVAALTPLGTAYREAGFGGDPRWHRYNASKLANKSNVKARIEALRLEFERLSAISVDYVRHKLLGIVDADVRELYEPDPDDSSGKKRRLRAIDKLPGHLASAVSRIRLDSETGEPVEILLAGKVEAAATLLRSLPGGSNDQPASVGLTQLNFHWGELGDISNDVPMQLTAKAEAQRAAAAAERLRNDPAAKERVMAMVEKFNRGELNGKS